MTRARRSTPVPSENEEDGDSAIEPESGSDHSAQPINTLAADTIKSLQMRARVRPVTPPPLYGDATSNCRGTLSE